MCVHLCMSERYSCYCTSTDIPMVHNIYVIPLREQSVFKSDYTIKKKKCLWTQFDFNHWF